MKTPRYLYFGIASIILFISNIIAIVYIISQIINNGFSILLGILCIFISTFLMSLVITVNSLIIRLGEVTEKVVELEDKLLTYNNHNQEED